MLSKTERKGELANVYLDPDQRFWHDVLRSYDDPWELVDCPVDASLEHRLWDEWTQSFNAGEYEMRVVRRHSDTTAFDATYGDVPDTGLGTGQSTSQRSQPNWRPGECGDYLRDVADLYGDVEDGTWQIDNAVFQSSSSPASRRPGFRSTLATATPIGSRFLVDRIAISRVPFTDSADRRRPDRRSRLAPRRRETRPPVLRRGTGTSPERQSVAPFIVDALRFVPRTRTPADLIRRELPRPEVDERVGRDASPIPSWKGRAHAR